MNNFLMKLCKRLYANIFFTKTIKLLSRPYGIMLCGNLGVEYFSTSALLYPNMKVRLRLIRARAMFYGLVTTPTLVLELLIVHFTLVILLPRMIITRKEWTCLLTLLWSSTIWKLLKRLSSFLPYKTSSFKKTLSTML